MTEVSKPPEYARMTLSRMETPTKPQAAEGSSSGGSPQLSTPFRLLMPAQIVSDMFAQACAELPNECCGLLAGNIETGQVTHRYPLVNIAASPVLYHNDAKDLFAAFRDMREKGVEHLAIYHSHPTSEAVPSKTDRANNF